MGAHRRRRDDIVALRSGRRRVLREPEPSHLEKVQTCLTERSTPYEPVSADPVAASAGRGALVTTVDGIWSLSLLGSSEGTPNASTTRTVAVGSSDVVLRGSSATERPCSSGTAH